MARNDRTTAGPYWTKHWIEKMWRFTAENFVNFDTGDVDFEALGREEYEFRKALFYRNFKNSERAKEAFVETEEGYKSHVESGKKGGRPKKSPQDAPNGNAGVDMSDAGNGAASKSPTSCDIYEQAGNPLTRESETRGPQTDNNSEAVKALADGDIREDSQAEPDGSAITRNETRAYDALEPSASIYATRQAKNGDAATREGAEASNCRESGVIAPTTVSKNMRRVPQNEAPAHGFSGGRTAQGTMSRSPEAAAQSGKAYDQETDQASTDEAREGQARESQGRAGADSVRGTPSHRAPARPRASFCNLPRNKEEVRLFAIDNGLDVDDANDWAEMNLRERHGRDKDGKPIRNWKGAILNYCKAMAAKRETA